jgi:hypothetical protein
VLLLSAIMADNEAIARRILPMNQKQLIAECKARNLTHYGSKAQMVDRLLQHLGVSREDLEEPLQHGNRAPPQQPQQGNATAQPFNPPQSQDVTVSREDNPPRGQSESQSNRLESLLTTLVDRMEKIEQRISVQEDMSSTLVSEVSAIPVDSSETRKFWPDLRFKSFDLSQDYEIYQKVGRLATSIRVGDPRNIQGVMNTAKQIEEIVARQATRVVLSDRGEEHVANFIATDDQGTFMDQFAGKIKDGRKYTGFKRRDSPSSVTHGDRTSSFTDFRQPDPKRQKALQCWTCGEFGHTKFVCKQKNRKLDQGNVGKPAIQPPKT